MMVVILARHFSLQPSLPGFPKVVTGHFAKRCSKQGSNDPERSSAAVIAIRRSRFSGSPQTTYFNVFSVAGNAPATPVKSKFRTQSAAWVPISS